MAKKKKATKQKSSVEEKLYKTILIRKMAEMMAKEEVRCELNNPDILRRRAKAIWNNMERIETLGNGDGNCFFLFELENIFTLDPYDLDEDYQWGVIGAAIWILDQIKKAGKYSELLEWMQSNMRTNEACAFLDESETIHPRPSFTTVGHRMEVVDTVARVIGNRYRDDSFMEGTNTYSYPYISEESVRKEKKKTANWVAYSSLIELVPHKKIKQATQNYEKVYWDITERTLKSFIHHNETRHIDGWGDVVNDIKCHIFGPAYEQPAWDIAKPKTSMPIPAKPMDRITEMHSTLSNFEKTTKIAQKIDNLDVELNTFIENLFDGLYAVCFPSLMKETPNKLKKFEKYWVGFDAGDPYEICFALIHLIDIGSDLPWCFFPGAIVHRLVCDKLPWAIRSLSPRKAASDDSEPENHENTETDWFELRYENNNLLFSLAQIIYAVTGVLLPQKEDILPKQAEVLQWFGMTMEEQKIATTIVELLRQEEKKKIYIVEKETTQDMELPDEPSAAELEAEIRRLRDENKALKQRTYDSERALVEEKKRFDEFAAEKEAEKAELNDLRELIFSLQADPAGSEDEAENNIRYPVRTQRKVVIFGGHASWLREMKQRFPDVRFIGKDLLPNENLIRNAEEVWIQPNALSHSYFYKIIDEVRRRNKPIRYFTHAGVNRCSNQLIQSESEVSK